MSEAQCKWFILCTQRYNPDNLSSVLALERTTCTAAIRYLGLKSPLKVDYFRWKSWGLLIQACLAVGFIFLRHTIEQGAVLVFWLSAFDNAAWAY